MVLKVICDLILSLGIAQNRQIHRDREQRSGCQSLGETVTGVTANGTKFLPGVVFWNHIVLMTSQLCEHAKKHSVVQLKA